MEFKMVSPPNYKPRVVDNARIFFDEQADRYSSFYDPETRSGAGVLFRMRADFAAEMIRGENASPMLDLATGTGEIALQIAQEARPASLTLNDFSEPMLRRCKEVFTSNHLGVPVTWSNRDVFAFLPTLCANDYGSVLCLGLIAHTGELTQLLKHCQRILKPGGVLLLQSSLDDHPGARITSLYAASPFRRNSHIHHSFRMVDIQTAATDAGLLIVDTRRFGVCFPFGDKLFKRANFYIEQKYAARMIHHGGEVVMKLRKT